ncbi:accessory gene regulator ArgB-like protein [Clostridium polynesiense]|uniref:accessory gene regulator ArgB-like protein n=1 Tax=Clostridium polynesiense TaxID=1325933 RepID=UPI00058C3675|nr:accessory gene regulator B family protein [Clostridium polynesiense]
MRKLISVFSEYIFKADNYTKDEKEKIEYTLRIVIYEFLKILGSTALYMIMGYPVQALTAAATMVITKPYMGGYHEDTQLKCFAATLIFLGSVIHLSDNVYLNLSSRVILSLILIFCIWNEAPVINPSMPLTKKELIDKNRNSATILASVSLAAAVFLNKYSSISNTILWIITFNTLLMFNKRKN